MRPLTVKKLHMNLRPIPKLYGAMGFLMFKNAKLNCLETRATGRPWTENEMKCHRRRRERRRQRRRRSIY